MDEKNDLGMCKKSNSPVRIEVVTDIGFQAINARTPCGAVEPTTAAADLVAPTLCSTSGGIPPEVEIEVDVKNLPKADITTVINAVIARSHPLAQIMPMMSSSELSAIIEDISTNGQANPIVMLDNRILDGRNREVACIVAGVKPVYIQFNELNVTMSPIEWVISQNVLRRHLTISQLAMIGANLIPELEKAAKIRQGARTDVHPDQKIECGRSADKAAKIIGVSPSSIKDALKVLRQGILEVRAAVMSGKITLNSAVRMLSKSPDEQRLLLASETRAILAALRNHEKIPDDLENVIEDYPELKPQLLAAFKNNPQIGKDALTNKAKELVAKKQTGLNSNKNSNGKPKSRMPDKDGDFNAAASVADSDIKASSREVGIELNNEYLRLILPFAPTFEHILNALRDLSPEMRKKADAVMATTRTLKIEIAAKRENI